MNQMSLNFGQISPSDATGVPTPVLCTRCNGRWDTVHGKIRHAPSCPEIALWSGVNTSGLEPQGYAVLVLPFEPEINSSTIIIPANVRERTATVETRAIVVEIGAQAWADEKKPRAAVGDKVLIARYAGVMAVGPADGRQYRMVNDRDIYCKIIKDSGFKMNEA